MTTPLPATTVTLNDLMERIVATRERIEALKRGGPSSVLAIGACLGLVVAVDEAIGLGGYHRKQLKADARIAQRLIERTAKETDDDRIRTLSEAINLMWAAGNTVNGVKKKGAKE